MKKILSAVLCFCLVIGMAPVFSANAPAVTSYGFLSPDGEVIGSLGGDVSVRAYADIKNPSYADNSNMGTLWLECYVDNILHSSKSVVLAVGADTLIKRMVTDEIAVPQGEVSFKAYITYDSTVTHPEVIIGTGNSEVPNSENDGVLYKREIEIIKALGIMSGYEDGSFGASISITRAEFAAVLTRLAGKEYLVEIERKATEFPDVNEHHWACGYVNIVSKMGIMGGVDGRFLPDAKVTFDEAIEALVNLLGYADRVGPFGYFDMAYTIGITKGTSMVDYSLVSRGKLAKLLANSIEIPLLIDGIIQNGTGDSAYLKNILSEGFSVAKLDAFVAARYDLSSINKKDLVRIEIINNYRTKFEDYFYYNTNVDVNVGNTALKSLVGYKACLYVRVDEQSTAEPTVLYCEKIPPEGELTISTDQLDNSFNDYGVVIINYFPTKSSSRTESITIPNNATVYINGFRSDTTVSNALNYFYGYATFALLDPYSTNEDYDTLFITDYQNTVIESVNTSTGRVVVKAGAPISFAVDNPDITSYLYDMDGKALDWRTLKENDLLSVQTVTNGVRKIYTATLVGRSVSGKITEVSGNGEFMIEGNSYKVDGQITSEYDLALEDEGTFYLDIMGRIAYFVPVPVVRKYAYVMAIDSSGTIDPRTEIKLLDNQGKVGVLKTASKVSVTDGSGNSLLINSSEVLQRVEIDNFISFDMNSSGEINNIVLPQIRIGEIGIREFSLYSSITGGLTAYYSNETKSIRVDGRRATITENTKIFLAPNSTFNPDENDFCIIPPSALKADQELRNVSVYDVNSDGEAGAVLINDPYSFDYSAGESIAVVVGKAEAEDENANAIFNYTLLQNGEETTVSTIDTALNISPGSVIVPIKNFRGKLVDYRSISATDEINDVVFYGNGIFDEVCFIGKVNDNIQGNIITIENEEVRVPSTANVYLYDEGAGKKVMPLDYSSMGVFYKDGDEYYDNGDSKLASVYAFAMEDDGVISDVVIYLLRGENTALQEGLSLYTANDLSGATAVYQNTMQEEITPILILARYKNGMLVDMSNIQKPIPANEFGLYKSILTADFKNNDKIKAMFIDGYGNVRPLIPEASEYIIGEADDADANEAVISSESIVSVQPSGNSFAVNYYENESDTNTKTVYVDANASVFINGAAANIPTNAALSGFYETACLQGKNTNNAYSKVYISEYTNLIVDYVKTESNRVYTKQGLSFSYGSSNLKNFSVLYDKDGNKIDWSVLKENDVLSTKIIDKGNAKVYIATLSTDTVSGIITESNSNAFTINGNRYKVDGKTTVVSDLTLEDEGTFYLDIFGRIAFFDIKSTVSDKYAYVIAAGTTGAIDQRTEMKMFTYEGNVETFTAASKIGLTDASGIKKSVNSTPTEGVGNDILDYVYKDTFITFDVNSSGEINKIMLPQNKTGQTNTRAFSLYSSGNADFKYRTYALTVDGRRVTITDRTKIFLAPHSNYYFNDEDFEIIPLSALTDDYYGWQEVSVYDVNEDGEAGAVVIGNPYIDLTSNATSIALVVKTTTVKNDEGDIIYKYTVLKDGELKVIDSVDSVLTLTPAQVIIPQLNTKGELKGFQDIARLAEWNDCVEEGYDLQEQNQSGNDVYYILGEATDIRSNKITINDEEFAIPSTANVYVYDEGASLSNRVTLSDLDFINVFYEESGVLYDNSDEVLESVYVLLREYQGTIVDVVIYLFK